MISSGPGLDKGSLDQKVDLICINDFLLLFKGRLCQYYSSGIPVTCLGVQCTLARSITLQYGSYYFNERNSSQISEMHSFAFGVAQFKYLSCFYLFNSSRSLTGPICLKKATLENLSLLHPPLCSDTQKFRSLNFLRG